MSFCRIVCLRQTLFALSALWLSTFAHAQPEILATDLATADALAESQQWTSRHEWRQLLYYPDDKNTSAVALPDFFVSPDGRSHPSSELHAEIAALRQDLSLNPPDKLDNKAFSCRFPARREWLMQQLKLTAPFDNARCVEFSEWLNGIRPHGATLVYASNNMDGPSSMFGHSLLRIDQIENQSNPILNYAVSYAAETNPKDNPVWYAAKGLFGLYPGAYALMPYYDKVKEYSDLEGRDLWEYELNLTPEETRRMTYHFWELKAVRFPYYYFHSNCAYELLHLLEVARPSIRLQREFPIYAIPAETIRTALKSGGLLQEIHFRSAFASRLSAQAHSEPARLTERAKQLAAQADLSLADLSEKEQATVLEMAYDYLYYQHLSHKADNVPQSQARLRTLLLRRSQLNIADQRPTLPTPTVDPANSHHDKRMTVMSGQADGKSIIDIDLRPAYHDALDPIGGYRAGASIDFLRATLRLTDNQARLQQFTLLNIDSLSARNAFFKPKTMNVKIAWERTPVLDGQGKFMYQPQWNLQGGSGLAYGKEDSALCFAQAQGGLQFSGNYHHHARIGAGPRIGCNWYPRGADKNSIQIMGQAQSLYFSNNRRWENTFSLGAQYQITQDFGIRIDGDANYLDHRWLKQWRMGVASYF